MRRLSKRECELIEIIEPYECRVGLELKLRDDAPPEVKKAREELLQLSEELSVDAM